MSSGPWRPKEIRVLCREMTGEAVAKLTELMRTGTPTVQLEAARSLIAWGWGRPPQSLTVEQADPDQKAKQDWMDALLRHFPEVADFVFEMQGRTLPAGDVVEAETVCDSPQRLEVRSERVGEG